MPKVLHVDDELTKDIERALHWCHEAGWGTPLCHAFWTFRSPDAAPRGAPVSSPLGPPEGTVASSAVGTVEGAHDMRAAAYPRFFAVRASVPSANRAPSCVPGTRGSPAP